MAINNLHIQKGLEKKLRSENRDFTKIVKSREGFPAPPYLPSSLGIVISTEAKRTRALALAVRKSPLS